MKSLSFPICQHLNNKIDDQRHIQTYPQCNYPSLLIKSINKASTFSKASKYNILKFFCILFLIRKFFACTRVESFYCLTTCTSTCEKKSPSSKMQSTSGDLTGNGQIFMTIKKQPSLLAKLAGSLESDPNWPPALALYFLCTTQQYSRVLCTKPHPNIC